MTNREKVDYINKQLGVEDLLLAVAEEAAELAQAALKLHRALCGKNPTPVTPEEAHRHLLEEVDDTLLSWLIFSQHVWKENTYSWDGGGLTTRQQQKLDRWAQRLKEAEAHAESEN